MIYRFLLLIFSILSVVSANCNILTLSGGGSFGAVEVGILDNLISTKQIPDKFDVIAGISTGGINAAVLSQFNDISSALPQIYNLFSNLKTIDVYRRNYIGIFTRWSIYDNSPLEQTLRNIITQLKQIENPPITIIGASNIYTQKLDIFKYNDLSLDDKINVLMSTTAIPIIFPPRKYNNGLYIDGGVISNEIIAQTIGQLECPFYNITFINANPLSQVNNKITDLTSYLSSIVRIILSTFNNQLSQVTSCSYPKGVINACFPTSPDLGHYDSLDFNNEAALYQLGKESNKCVQYQLC